MEQPEVLASLAAHVGVVPHGVSSQGRDRSGCDGSAGRGVRFPEDGHGLFVLPLPEHLRGSARTVDEPGRPQTPLPAWDGEPDAANGAAATSLDTHGISGDFAVTKGATGPCTPADRPGPHGEQCGKWLGLLCIHCGATKPIYQACEDRIRCPECRKSWIRPTSRRFLPVLDAMHNSGGHLRFITLTVAGRPSLADAYDHLLKSLSLYTFLGQSQTL